MFRRWFDGRSCYQIHICKPASLLGFQPFTLSSAILEGVMLKKEPGQRLAFLPNADVESLAECLVAFANGDGGLIVLGLDEQIVRWYW